MHTGISIRIGTLQISAMASSSSSSSSSAGGCVDGMLRFQIVDIQSAMIFGERFKDMKQRLYVYGRALDGTSVTLFVDNYHYSVVIDPGTPLHRRRSHWDKEILAVHTARRIKQRIRRDGYVASFENTGITFRSCLGFEAPITNGVRMSLYDSRDVATVRTMVDEAGGTLYDADLPYEMKFLVDRRLRAGGWIQIPEGHYYMRSMGEAFTDVCARVNDPRRIKPWDEGNRHGTMAPLRVLAFDIEVAGQLGRFPTGLDDEPVIQIASIVHEVGRTWSIEPTDDEPVPTRQSDPPLAYNIMQWKTSAPLDEDRMRIGGVAPEVIVTRTDIANRTDEAELLDQWLAFVRRVDPDVVTGWNTTNFDLPYIVKRAQALKLENITLGRVSGFVGRAYVKKSQFDSKAYGKSNNFKTHMPGRASLDGLVITKREYKLRSYTLNNVSAEFLRRWDPDAGALVPDSKDDLHHSFITPYWEADDEKRGILAEYCLKDTTLVPRLIYRLQYMPKMMEMSRVTGVTPQMQVDRGQTIKTLFLIYDKLHERRLASRPGAVDYMYAPHVTSSVRRRFIVAEGEKFEGATVVDMVKGYHKDPVTTLDFSSLYPSIMRAHNLCASTLYLGPSTDHYLRALGHDPQSEEVVVTSPVGHRFITKKVMHGILPSIEDELIAARKVAKKAMAAETDPFRYAVQDARQLALKITCNSAYGFTGDKNSKLPAYQVAESVTSWGRQMLETTISTVTEHYAGSRIVYGDSVPGETPVVVMLRSGFIDVREIETLFDHGQPDVYSLTQTAKAYRRAPDDVLGVWTERGFSPIKYVMRHDRRATTRLIEMTVSDGSTVVVTDDHSLLDHKARMLKPTEVEIGVTRLLTTPLPTLSRSEDDTHVRIPMATFRSYGRAVALGTLKRIPASVFTSSRAAKLHFYNGFVDNIQGPIFGALAQAMRLIEHDIDPEHDHTRQQMSGLVVAMRDVTDEYGTEVYDLETLNHHFAAGIGTIVVHNTDSVFVDFGDEDKSIARAMHLGKEACELVNAKFKAPISLEFEKVLAPVRLIAKKKYTGKYWTKPDKHDKIYNRGIETERRDNAPMVGKTLRRIQKALFEDESVEAAVAAAKDAVKRVYMCDWPLEDYVISETLAKEPHEYKPMRPAPALALKLRKRDPMIAPRLGQRVPYVMLPKLKGTSQADAAEAPGYARENSMWPDPDYYVESQLRGPIERLLKYVIPDKEIREIFTGSHTRKRKRILPKSGGLMNFFSAQPTTKKTRR